MIDLDKKNKIPLYMQLYNYFKNEIQKGNYKADDKLPSKRILCSKLKISQNTVENAYGLLLQEGYIISKPKKGYFVTKLHKDTFKKNKYNFKEEKSVSENIKYDFSTSLIDVNSFPFSTWSKISKEIMYNNPELLKRGDFQGDINLRNTISHYLYTEKGVIGKPSQIIIGAGIEYLMDMLIEVLPKDSIYALENPGYTKIYTILKNNNKKTEFISLNDYGMDFEMLKKSSCNIAYLTPSHQFPTGVIMPVYERTKFLKWAQKEKNRYIIEDDYDSEYNYKTKPIPPISGFDNNDKVIYISTFSRTLSPSIRIAYMVLPENLLKKYKEMFSSYSCTVSRFEQHTLEKFIKDGYLTRHLNRTKNLYRKKTEQIIISINQLKNKSKIKISKYGTGLYLIMEVNTHKTIDEIYNLCNKYSVKLYPMESFFHNKKDQNKKTFVLGYCGLSLEDIKTAVSYFDNIFF